MYATPPTVYDDTFETLHIFSSVDVHFIWIYSSDDLL